MEIPIRPKLYSFHEAFNALGRELFPNWTGFEINAQKCRPPKDVESMADLPERLMRVIDGMDKNPGLGAEGMRNLQKHIDGANAALLVRQSDTVARAIKALKEDPEAYQTKYDLWFRHDKAYKRLIDILHDGYAPSWLVTKGGDTYEIQRTHWGGAGGPFTPNLPGNCGEYRGAWGVAWGEVLIDKKSLDRFLKIHRTGPARRGRPPTGTSPEKRQEYEEWAKAAKALKAQHTNWSMDQAMEQAADDMDINRGTFKRRLIEQKLV